MPTYSYACTVCDHRFDIRQSFTDETLTDCPVCFDATLRKVIHPVGISFKGSGFYKTDSRPSSTATSPAGTGGSSQGKGDASSSESSSSSGEAAAAASSTSSTSDSSTGASTVSSTPSSAGSSTAS